MNLFFDNTFPPPLARFLGELAARAREPERYLHLLHHPEWKGADPGDPVWIPEVCRWPDPWAIITGDLGSNAEDRAAWQACSRPVLLTSDRFVNVPIWEQTKRIVNAWENVLEWARGRPTGRWKLRAGGGAIERMR